MDSAEVLAVISSHAAIAVGLVGALILARWSIKALGLLVGSSSGSSRVDAKSDRTLSGWYSHEQGMTGYEPDYRAISGSIERHMRKKY